MVKFQVQLFLTMLNTFSQTKQLQPAYQPSACPINTGQKLVLVDRHLQTVKSHLLLTLLKVIFRPFTWPQMMILQKYLSVISKTLGQALTPYFKKVGQGVGMQAPLYIINISHLGSSQSQKLMSTLSAILLQKKSILIISNFTLVLLMVL